MRIMKINGIGAFFCLLLLGSARAQGALSVADVPKIECDALYSQMKQDNGLVVVDVRAPIDFNEAHITGAVSVPFYKLPKEAVWPKQTSLVLYCAGQGCALSYDSALNLIKAGYVDVKVLNGGIKEWMLREYPVTRAAKAEAAAPLRENTVFKGKTVTAKQLSEYLKQAPGTRERIYVLDLRPGNEFEAAHLPGAVNIPLENLQEKLKTLPAAVEVVVCDKAPERSAQAVALLNQAGFPAHALTGGIIVWSAAGYPLAAGKGNEK